MSKILARYIVDILLIISFIIVAVTGILKFPPWLQFFSPIYQLIPRITMAKLHDISGFVMTILVIVHLIFNWNFLSAMTKKYIFRK